MRKAEIIVRFFELSDFCVEFSLNLSPGIESLQENFLTRINEGRVLK